MTRAKKIEKVVNDLWKIAHKNPLALIAITEIQERRERHNGWLYEDELPADYDYDANFHRSEVRDGVRMFPAK